VKRFLHSVIYLLALFGAVPQVVHAQDAGPSPDSTSVGHRPTPEEVVARMDARLSLTDDQKAKITPIIAERQEKMKALADSGGRRRKKGREMRSIIQDSDKKINAVLNDDQKRKYAEMEQEMREQRKQRRANRGE